MNNSPLKPYRLPISVLIFWVSYLLLTRTLLSFIPETSSVWIGAFFVDFDVLKETEQITLIYAIILSVIGYFYVGKLMKIDAQENNKRLLKNLAFVAAIAIAYVYSIVQ